MDDLSKKEAATTNQAASYAFAGANVFANAESGNLPGLICSVATAATVLAASRYAKPPTLMRINSVGMVLTGIVTLATGGIAPKTCVTAAVDFLFGKGNWLASRKDISAILQNPAVRGVRRALNHPATYYGLAYVGTGLLASGVLGGSGNIYALLSMSADVAMTGLSLTGLLTDRFKNPAASYMAVAFGSFAGVISGICSGNIWGVLNKAGSAVGEFALAYKENAAHENRLNASLPVSKDHASAQRPAATSRFNVFFNAASDVLTRLPRALRKLVVGHYAPRFG